MNSTSKLGIGSSIGLIVSFLLPWIQIMGFGASGYNLAQLGSYGNLAWIVPVVGIVCLLGYTSKQSLIRARKSVSMIGASLVAGGMVFVLTQVSERAGEGVWHAIGIGVYILLISAIALFVAGWMTPLEAADKAVLVVLGSYFVMVIVLFVAFTGLYLALGAERAFKPDSYEVSTLWLTISTIISICSAILGGYVCAAIAKSMRACQVLALIVLVLGIILCLPKMHEDPHVRAGEVPTLQVMQLAQMPVWMHVLTPVLGAVGVLLGARIRKFPAA